MVMPLLEHPIVMLLIALLASFTIAITVIPAIIRVAHEKHLMDEPNGRSSHQHKTPSLGGVAIFAAIAIVFTVIAQWISPSSSTSLQILPSIVILFFIGLKDDILVIDPTKKLLVQIFASLVFILFSDIRIGSLYGIFGINELPYLLSVGLTLFIFIVITNAYNLIDGIDGLAGCLGIVAAIVFGIYYVAANVMWAAVLCITLIGALVGFLRFNFSNSRKIFMGDSGSLIVGFILAVVSIKFIQFNEGVNALYVKNAPAIAIIALAIPLFDTLRVFIHRIIQGHSPFRPDRNHIHHLLIERGYTHFQVSMSLAIFSLATAMGGYFLFRHASVEYSLLAVLAVFVGYALTVWRRPTVQKSKVFVQKHMVPPSTVSTVQSQPFAQSQPTSAPASASA